MIPALTNSWHSRGLPRFVFIHLVILFLILPGAPVAFAADTASLSTGWRSAAVEAALVQSGTNRQELIKALEQAPQTQREGLQFLLENMPERDLKTLSASFLLENLGLAYRAREDAPWGKSISTGIFLNDVLPYASVNEPRDNWRKRLNEIAAPLVKDCKTPAEAAQRLNSKLFGHLKVRYSTQRRRPDQGPFETMESGMATCTGLSILLVDACRAVSVPARIAATPLWTNQRGNHTWVEIWDGDWHFTGAAEQDSKGLDRGWFVHDASQAIKDQPEHAIYASSFKKTGTRFPLAWARRVDYVSAVNVTDRYAPKDRPGDTGKMRLQVKVLDRPAGKRIAANVTITSGTSSALRFTGTSKDESADLNDFLTFDLPKQRTYLIEAEHDGHSQRRQFTAGTNAQEVLVISLTGTPPASPTPAVCYVPPPVSTQLSADDTSKLTLAFTACFTATAEEQAAWKFPGDLEQLLRENEPAVRAVAWKAFRAAPIHTALKEDFETNQVRFEKHLSPYTVKTVGERPTNGWALFIAMHGGGGAPKEVNDSQWKVMQRYYRDHPEAGGYRYLAVRAPNDTWNGFYADYVYPLVANLIRQFLLFDDVDPNKVFLMGYSHGGYGAFAIGPKMPDRFAAIHASAAAPTDGETTAKTLRNTIFTCMIGEKDLMYGRLDRCKRFDESVQKLRGDRTDIYPVTMQLIAGNGHTGLPDRDKIADLYPAVRHPVPRELSWLMTDGVVRDFFWLHVPQPGKRQEIEATCRNNRLTISTSTNVTSASVLLDGRLVDFAKPVTLELNGKISTCQVQPSLRVLCETLRRRGDPELAFTAEIELPLAGAGCLPNGRRCQTHTACCSGFCKSGFCAPCQPKGTICYSNEACCSGTCYQRSKEVPAGRCL
jgi:pimeloyl-ACP methyl ester carboxylesterase